VSSRILVDLPSLTYVCIRRDSGARGELYVLLNHVYISITIVKNIHLDTLTGFKFFSFAINEEVIF
jgi:hypothetical protein